MTTPETKTVNLTKKPACILCDSSESYLSLVINSHSIYHCKDCGLAYVYPIPSEEDLSSYYSKEYPLEHVIQDEESHLRKGKKLLQEVQTHRPDAEGLQLLDVGCAYGHFLKEARDVGWNVKGVEVSSPAYKHAVERFLLDVDNNTLTESSFPSGYFDVITLWHVLEHVRDPIKTLDEARRILKEDGLIFLTVPNMKSLVARFSGPRWSWLDPPSHVYYFSPDTLLLLLERAGLSCLVCKTREGDSGNPYYRLLRTLFSPVRPSSSRVDTLNRQAAEDRGSRFGSFLHYGKLVVRTVLDGLYILSTPIVWLLWRLGLGAEVFMVAREKAHGPK